MNKLTTILHIPSLFFTLLLALLLVSGIPTSNLSAEGFRVAIVDMDRVLNESKEAKIKKAELEKLKNEKKKSLDTQRANLTKIESNLKQKKVSPDSKEADEFRAQARDFTKKAQDAEEDLKRRYLTSTKNLIDKAQVIISKHSKANNINLVLEHGKDQKGAVLYSSNVLDITDEVIKQLNAG